MDSSSVRMIVSWNGSAFCSTHTHIHTLLLASLLVAEFSIVDSQLDTKMNRWNKAACKCTGGKKSNTLSWMSVWVSTGENSTLHDGSSLSIRLKFDRVSVRCAHSLAAAFVVFYYWFKYKLNYLLLISWESHSLTVPVFVNFYARLWNTMRRNACTAKDWLSLLKKSIPLTAIEYSPQSKTDFFFSSPNWKEKKESESTYSAIDFTK